MNDLLINNLHLFIRLLPPLFFGVGWGKAQFKAYEKNGEIIDFFPSDLDGLEPIYEELDGWDKVEGIRNFDDLPANAKAYIKRIEELTGVKVGIISTSPERDDTIVR